MRTGILKIIAGAGVILLGTMPALAQQYAWSNFTGHPGGAGNVDGPGTAARFQSPNSVAVDAGGTVYVADTGNNTVRKVMFSGTNCTVTTLAGMSGVAGSSDGTGGAAQFNNPCGVAVDANGNVYVADSGNYTIRKITPTGGVTTLAGSPGQFGNTDGSGNGALFGYPMGIAVDSNLNLYVADSFNHTIRKVTPDGTVTTLAGCPNVMGSNDGTGNAALFNTPEGVTVDGSGTVYVADTLNHTIRKITPTGAVTTLAGTPCQYGLLDGTANGAQFNTPSAVAVDGAGSVYVADTYNSMIRKVTAGGVVTTLSGSDSATGISAITSGFNDGAGTAAQFNFPAGITVDANGNVYVADTNNHTIRKETWTVVTTVAGTAPQPGHNGAGVYGFLNYPTGMTIDSSGNLYVADTLNQTIVKCTGTGNSLIAGQMLKPGSTDAAGNKAAFNYPEGIAVDSGTNLYVADSSSHTIREVSLVSGSWVVTTICGFAASQGSADGSGSSAMFNNPIGIAVDGGTNLYIADTYNSTIRKVTCSGSIWMATTIAGNPGVTGTADGSGNGALFNYPYGIAVDGGGNVYVADTRNYAIRKLTLSGSLWSSQTIAGTPGVTGTADGTGAAAQFAYPTMLTLDSSGNLFVTDAGSSTVRMLTNSGGNWTVTTIGGTPGMNGGANGIGAQAQFSAPMGIAVGSSPLGSDLVYVLDSDNNRITVGTAAMTGTTYGITSGSAILTGVVNPNGVATSVYFQYGTSTTYGHTTGTQSIGSASSFVSVSTTISGLSSNKTYNYQIVVVNSSGTYYGLNQVFVTLPSAVPSITSSKLITGTNGYPLSYTIVASNAPTSYGVNALPVGLTLNPLTGVIAGTPSVTASTNVILTSTNVVGTSTTSIAFNIINLPLPVFTSSGTAFAIYGSTFNDNITAINGSPSYGTNGLPAGLILNSSNGLISGTPNLIGTTSVTLTAMNASGTSTMPLTLSVTPPYVWSNISGLPGVAGFANGTGTNARFTYPESVAVDSGSNIYVADTGRNTIRKITPAGVVSVLAGSGVSGYLDGTGTNAQFYSPYGIAVDSGSNVYVADKNNCCIRKITPTGVVSTFAGSRLTGFANGTGTSAMFFDPLSVAVDSGSNVYVADTYNNMIRKITPGGMVTTLAGSLTSGTTDGTGTNAKFATPQAIAVDSGSNVYVADTGNYTIRKVTPAGVVTTLAGNPSAMMSGSSLWLDGIGSNATFDWVQGIAVDGGTNLYVADTTAYVVRKMIPSNGSWMVTTIGGSPNQLGTNSGIGCAAYFGRPAQITVDNSGNLYFADSFNSCITQGTIMQVPTITSALTATGTEGIPFSYTITANVYPQSYGITGLFSGLHLNPTTGLLSGTPGVSGTFPLGITASNLVGSGSATLTLTLLPGITPYQTWRSIMFSGSQLAVTALSGDLATPSGDGVSNLMKYALHLNPYLNGVSGLPMASTVTINGSKYLTLTYTSVIAATDLTYTVQISTDLQTWNSGPGYTTTSNVTNNSDRVTQTVTIQSLLPLSGTTSKQFIRLQISH